MFDIALNTIILLISFIGMEFFSWAFHKYIMHGILWNIHKTHHTKQESVFELNDIFSLSFGSIATLLIFIGIDTFSIPFWIGMGITCYGIVYFILHDFFIHKRISANRAPWNGRYLRGITKAHQAHHQSNKKEEGQCFGLLLVSRKYFFENKP